MMGMIDIGLDMSLFYLFLAILIVGVLIFLAIRFSQHKGHSFDKEEYQYLWMKVENGLAKENLASYNMAVVEADKLLDKAMCEMGVTGNNMGERLKRSGDKFSAVNAVWYAHKLRNQIAHEPGFNIKYEQARNALKTFKQALKDLGAV